MERNVRLSFLKPSASLGVIANTKIKVFQQGRKLLQEIFLTNFASLSRHVKFHDGKMYGSSYEIVNVVGKSYQAVGYWTYNSSKLFIIPSFGKEGLRLVIWPSGISTKIAVPATGWEQFVNVWFKPESNETTLSGFVIDVFDAVLKRLDYPLLYDFTPLSWKNDSFNELVRQVHLKSTRELPISYVLFRVQNYDAVVVIVARTATTEEVNNGCTFLQPFTPAPWAITAVFILYTGLVVWLLEHKINPYFRGSSTNQVVTLLWFAFSAVFYSHQERIRNSLSRIVVVVWLFVAFILTSSYTANLASRLTAEQITPLINGLGNYKVGYHGSYVGSFLRDNLGIAKKQLDPTLSPLAFEQALSKGAKNGDVDAILDEVPYVRAFLSGRCGYSIVGRRYPNGGFGFVFLKAFPLVQDIFWAILNLSDSGEIHEIEDKYFKGYTISPKLQPL
ncbi:glutamate receptor 3.2-like [Cryptomeria japonica]|uniref:glutamate receptor 3.2-like n=1 Tax=Cryptomeria japonica TaxID=3369 RepID=UPI0027DA9013|nr:glutamate receptor 3.2-like [Cryptomeria japonica]